MSVGISDIFDYIKSRTTTTQELAEDINELILDTDRSEFSKQLNNYWTEYCEANNICECCGSSKQIRESPDNEIVEFQGFPCRQIIYESYCPKCG